MHTIEYYFFKLKNEILAHTTTWINLEGIMLCEEVRHKRTIVYDSTYENYLE